MTFSSLISGTIPHHDKYSSRGGSAITRVLQHHHAATSDAGTNRLTDPNAAASVHYNILNDGTIWGQVPEEFRAWTSGSAAADGPSITFEVQNSGGQINDNDNDAGSWAISEAAYNSVIRLLADISIRYGWGAINTNNYQGHRQHYATACPGGFLWSRMDQTRKLTNQFISSGISPQGGVSKEDDELTAQYEQDTRAEWDGLRKFQTDVRAVLNGLPSLDRDLRADLRVKGEQLKVLTATNEALVKLLSSQQSLDLAAVQEALNTALSGIKFSVEVEKE